MKVYAIKYGKQYVKADMDDYDDYGDLIQAVFFSSYRKAADECVKEEGEKVVRVEIKELKE